MKNGILKKTVNFLLILSMLMTLLLTACGKKTSTVVDFGDNAKPNYSSSAQSTQPNVPEEVAPEEAVCEEHVLDENLKST